MVGWSEQMHKIYEQNVHWAKEVSSDAFQLQKSQSHSMVVDEGGEEY